MTRENIKGNFWRKIFRRGYNASGYHADKLNGNLAKTDAIYTRSRLKRQLDKLMHDNIRKYDERE